VKQTVLVSKKVKNSSWNTISCVRTAVRRSSDASTNELPGCREELSYPGAIVRTRSVFVTTPSQPFWSRYSSASQPRTIGARFVYDLRWSESKWVWEHC